jgi:hypothetical protein
VGIKYRYNVLVDPWPRRWYHGWASRAQRRHFTADPKLHKYVGGMDFWTPQAGKRRLSGKLERLPNRLHPKRRRRRPRR